jgi:predicted nucleotidyltransferase component of viral defense system
MNSIDKDKLRQFLDFISSKQKITAKDLLEKDFYLNVLLSKLDLKEYAFKGGTCLAKCYLDYFRFSEDLDFTFIDQKQWKGKSTKSIKKICKEKINLFGEQLEDLGFDFKFDKKNRDFVQIGSNNKIVTYKVYYNSIITGNKSFIKLQINFLENIMFEIKARDIIPLVKHDDFSKEDQIYYKDFLGFYMPVKLPTYDIKEIVAEKARSLLTRRAIKARDAIDLLCIYKKFKLKPQELFEQAKEKIVFAITAYEKYKENFLLTKKSLESLKFDYNEVRQLVISKFSREEFDDYIKELKPFVISLSNSIA